MATQYTAGIVQGQKWTAAIANQIGAAWEPWTPNFRPESGAWTTASTQNARYCQIQKLWIATAQLTITAFGTGNGAVFFTLPASARSPISTNQSIGFGRETALTGNAFTVYTNGTTEGVIRFFNNGNTANANNIYPIFIAYEAA